MNLTADFTVIGAGVVGASIAFGLLKRGHSVVVLDGSRADPRASGANFGLVWVQGKGPGVPEYQRLTRTASDGWAEYAAQIAEVLGDKSGSLAYERNGGLTFTFGEDGFQERQNQLNRLHNERGADGDDHEMVDRSEIQKMMPEFELGTDVSGASFCWRDGCVNPLKLHAALLRAIERFGGTICFDAKVETMEKNDEASWTLCGQKITVSTGHVVAAAGLGTREIANQLGLDVPVRPQRGQIIVSQRMPRVMGLPASTLRQTADGTFMVGVTKEDVGLDQSTSLAAAGQLARNATRITPMLKDANVVRHWSGLRVMTPDGAPIYDFSETASAAACHSGITLAPIHSDLFVECLLGNKKKHELAAFHPTRFRSAT